jgi:hypothetical protein
MSKYKDPNSWSNGGNKRSDFQHTHDGPEELPSKKQSKKAGRKKARCDHNYKLIEERKWYFREDYIQKQLYYRCSKCNKKKHELIMVHKEW